MFKGSNLDKVQILINVQILTETCETNIQLHGDVIQRYLDFECLGISRG